MFIYKTFYFIIKHYKNLNGSVLSYADLTQILFCNELEVVEKLINERIEEKLVVENLINKKIKENSIRSTESTLLEELGEHQEDIESNGTIPKSNSGSTLLEELEEYQEDIESNGTIPKSNSGSTLLEELEVCIDSDNSEEIKCSIPKNEMLYNITFPEHKNSTLTEQIAYLKTALTEEEVHSLLTNDSSGIMNLVNKQKKKYEIAEEEYLNKKSLEPVYINGEYYSCGGNPFGKYKEELNKYNLINNFLDNYKSEFGINENIINIDKKVDLLDNNKLYKIKMSDNRNFLNVLKSDKTESTKLLLTQLENPSNIMTGGLIKTYGDFDPLPYEDNSIF